MVTVYYQLYYTAEYLLHSFKNASATYLLITHITNSAETVEMKKCIQKGSKKKLAYIGGN